MHTVMDHARDAVNVPLPDVAEAKQQELFPLLVDGFEAALERFVWIPKDAGDDWPWVCALMLPWQGELM